MKLPSLETAVDVALVVAALLMLAALVAWQVRVP